MVERLMKALTANDRPRRWELLVLTSLVLAAVGFGIVVELRSAFLQRRMGDLGVFLRAGWAVRKGGERLYTLTDDNGWHYAYPPTPAILLAPFADPPPGETGRFLVPYPVTVGLWYVFTLAALAWAVHALANVLDPSLPRGGRRWWALRLVPIIVCLVPIGHTAARGQVNLFVLALMVGFIASTIRGRRLTAGLFLAASICLKIFPGFLVLIPLCRRDVRCLSGCAMGLFAGLILIPAAVLGPEQTVSCYTQIYREVVTPALKQDGNTARSRELTNVTATDSQAFVNILHNTLHVEREHRPLTASLGVRLAHWGLGGLLTLVTLLVFVPRRGRLPAGQHEVLFAGTLTLCMMLLCPVCHLHYFCLSIPLIMGLLVATRGDAVYPTKAVQLLCLLFFVGQLLPQIPAFFVLRDLGVASYGALLLWGCACGLALRRAPVIQRVKVEERERIFRAA